MPWREMVASPEVDAVVAVATPEVTTAVVEACAGTGRGPRKRCLATKPLLCSDMPGRGYSAIDAYVHVDLWRLYSPAWQAMRAELQGKRIESVEVVCVGDGPVREFSGILDYGPHALAFVGDLLGTVPETWDSVTTRYGNRATWQGQARGHGLETVVRVRAGSDAPVPEMFIAVRVDGAIYRWREYSDLAHRYTQREPAADAVRVSNHRADALRAFCRAFLNGEPSDTLRLSVEGMRVLQKVVGS